MFIFYIPTKYTKRHEIFLVVFRVFRGLSIFNFRFFFSEVKDFVLFYKDINFLYMLFIFKTKFCLDNLDEKIIIP